MTERHNDRKTEREKDSTTKILKDKKRLRRLPGEFKWIEKKHILYVRYGRLRVVTGVKGWLHVVSGEYRWLR